MNESVPGAFGETVSTLYLGGRGNDLGLVVVDPSEAFAPDEFLVKVSLELAGEVADIRTELGEVVDDLV